MRALSVFLHPTVDLPLTQDVVAPQGLTIGLGTRPSLFFAKAEIRRHWLRHLAQSRPVGANLVAERVGEAFVFRAEPHGLFAGIAARIWFALDHHGEHAVLTSDFLKVRNLLRHVRGIHRAR